jgi:hypothetical protein
MLAAHGCVRWMHWQVIRFGLTLKTQVLGGACRTGVRFETSA